MSFYAATVGELLIICTFGFVLWLKALIAAFVAKDQVSNTARKVKITSLGIVLVCLSVGGIMAYRVYELATGFWPFVWGIIPFYMLLGAGNICFIISATIGGDKRLFKWFVGATVVWTAYCVFKAFIW